MAHGIIRNFRHGVVHGVKHGGLTLGAPTIPGVTFDSASGKAIPQTLAEWGNFLAAAGLVNVPTGLWRCQEASGNLADSIGANPLVVTGSPTFQNALPGWSTKSVNITATTGQMFALGTGVYDGSAQSIAWLIYGRSTTTPGGTRTMFAASNSATFLTISHLTNGKLELKCGATAANSVNSYTGTAIFPMLLVYNRTSSTCVLYTNLEVLSVAFTSIVDGSKGIGGLLGSADAFAGFNYLAAWNLSAAEFTTAQARALLNTANWAVPW
jgi:hypothetical protein